MQKQNNCKPVGADLVSAKNKGITLIALIITIIVMLILLGVTINVSLNGGLFEKAKEASYKTEEQAIYDQIVGGMALRDNGKILVKETYSVAKNMLQGEEKTVNLVSPATEEEITNSVVFEVVGNNVTYIYTITEEKIIIGKEEVIEKVYSFTLNELGEWGVATDSRIEFNINDVWQVVGENLLNNSKYSLIDEKGDSLFSIETDNNMFGNLLQVTSGSSVGNEVEFLVAADSIASEEKWEFIVFNADAKELLADNPGEGQMTHQEFMDTYGDVEFRFADVSSLEIPTE